MPVSGIAFCVTVLLSNDIYKPKKITFENKDKIPFGDIEKEDTDFNLTF